jgi:phospholipid transport system transporter-binding protein
MIRCDNGRCTLDGAVTIENAEAVLAEGSPIVAAGDVTIDLAGVTEVDSSAVSILLEWRRAAARSKHTVRYTNLPGNLASLATLYGVSEFLSA